VSSARSIIEAESPKRFLAHQQELKANTLAGWLKREFEQKNPTLFGKRVAAAVGQGDLQLRGNIWVTLYGTSVWYRLVLLFGPSVSSPVWGTWEINPPREEGGEQGLRAKLKALTDEILFALHNPPAELGGVAQRRWIDTQIERAFDAAK